MFNISKKNRDKTIKISVIILVNNAEKYIKRCLDSIIKQTLKDIEVIIMDNASTDGSLAFCEEYLQKDTRIRLFSLNQKDESTALNRGLKEAVGDYIYIINSDSYCEDSILEQMYIDATSKKLDLVFCNYKVFSDENSIPSFAPYKKNSLFNATTKVLDNKDNGIEFVTGTTLYKRSLIKNNLLDELKKSNDKLFHCLAYCCANKISYLSGALCCYHINKNLDITQNLTDALKIVDDFKLLVKFLEDKKIQNQSKVFSLMNNIIPVFLFKIKMLCFPVQHQVMNAFKKELINFRKKYSEIEGNLKECIDDILNEKQWNERNLKVIPVVFSVNEEYSLYTCVAIQSIIKHSNSNFFYDIYILYSELSSEAQSYLKSLSSKNIAVSCINVLDKVASMQLFTSRHITKESYYRFFIPELLAGYSKVVYLDGDVIVQDDIAKLLDYNINDMAVGAAVNPMHACDIVSYIADTLHVNPKHYVNAGVLVFNIGYWRENKISQKCWDEVFNLSGDVFCMHDQDVLNYICKDKIYFIPSNWNILCNEYAKTVSYRKSITSYQLIHFASEKKPWNTIGCDFSDLWWNEARKTPVYEKILQINRDKLLKTPFMFYCSSEDYEKCKASPFWDAQYYKKRYSVKNADLLQHYLTSGWKDGYNPSQKFNTNAYLEINKDVKNAEINPLWHYVLFGEQERRPLGNETGTNQAINFCETKPSLFDKFICLFKNKKPLISIIVASYNYEHYIQHTLNSLLNQTYQNYEIIVVDDGSTDGSVQLIKKYEKEYPKIHLFLHPNSQNKGLPETVKLGVSKAKGKYVAFCEADDFWTKTHLEEKVKLINRFAFVNIISNDLFLFGDQSRITELQYYIRYIKKNVTRTKNPPFAYEENCIPSFSACMVKKRILEKCDFNAFFRATLDWWLWRQILVKYPLFYVNKKITYWRMNQSSQMSKAWYAFNKCKAEDSIKMEKLLYKRYPFKMRKLRKSDLSIYQKKPSFSIICSTYNSDFCLFDAIDSLLNQTYQNFELILVDNGSTDKTKELLYKKYKKELENGKIRYFYTSHVNMARARNIGLKNAQYQWISYLNPDDVLSTAFLECIAIAVCQNPQKMFFYSRSLLNNQKKIRGDAFGYNRLLNNNYIDLGTVVHSQDLYRKLEGFDEKLTIDEDYDLILRYTRENTPIFIPKILVLYNDSIQDYQRVVFKNHMNKSCLVSKIPQIIIPKSVKLFGNTLLKLRSEKKTALFIMHELTITGAPLCQLLKARLLKEKGYEIITLSLKDGPLKDDFKKLGMVFISQNIAFNYLLMTIADTVIIETFVPFREYLLASKIKPTMWFISEIPTEGNAFMLSTIRKAKELFVYSEWSRLQWLEYNEKIEVIHHGITDCYKNVLLNVKPLIFAIIGTICSRKGHDVLIKAILKIPPDIRKNAKFYVLGDDGYEKDFIKNLKECSCQEISFIPAIKEKEKVMQFYEQTSCLIVPSRQEPTSLVAIEGMMMGRPVIMSDHVGAKYLFNGKNGFLFSSDNDDELASILIDIIKNPEQLYAMGEEARKVYLDNNLIEKFEEYFMDSVQKVIKDFKKDKR